MLEALAHHHHRQTEARDCQEYQWQQDNTDSPIADFPSPMPVDREDPTDLDSLEGTTATPPPSSPATSMAPLKKKITIQEYHPHKTAEEQWATTFLDQDEYGEDLDYEDYELQYDPANIQIGYRTPMPIMQIPALPHFKMPLPWRPGKLPLW